MSKQDAQDKKITRGREERQLETERSRLGEIRPDSQSYGAEQIKPGFTNSSGENTDWKLAPVRDTTAGKILERLEALEEAHLSYVHSHQSRLKARLEESKAGEEKFLTEANQIKSDLYHLAQAQQKASENGHKN